MPLSYVTRHMTSCFAYLSALIELSKGRKLTGYEIIAHLRTFGLEISPGTVYNQLAALSRDGIIRAERQSNPRRRTVYEMTEEGRGHLEEFRKSWVRNPLPALLRNSSFPICEAPSQRVGSALLESKYSPYASQPRRPFRRSTA